MQNSLWKLTALAGVVGIGFLAVLQAQRGLNNPDPAADPAALVVDAGHDEHEHDGHDHSAHAARGRREVEPFGDIDPNDMPPKRPPNKRASGLPAEMGRGDFPEAGSETAQNEPVSSEDDGFSSIQPRPRQLGGGTPDSFSGFQSVNTRNPEPRPRGLNFGEEPGDPVAAQPPAGNTDGDDPFGGTAPRGKIQPVAAQDDSRAGRSMIDDSAEPDRVVMASNEEPARDSGLAPEPDRRSENAAIDAAGPKLTIPRAASNDRPAKDAMEGDDFPSLPPRRSTGAPDPRGSRPRGVEPAGMRNAEDSDSGPTVGDFPSDAKPVRSDDPFGDSESGPSPDRGPAVRSTREPAPRASDARSRDDAADEFPSRDVRPSRDERPAADPSPEPNRGRATSPAADIPLDGSFGGEPPPALETKPNDPLPESRPTRDPQFDDRTAPRDEPTDRNVGRDRSELDLPPRREVTPRDTKPRETSPRDRDRLEANPRDNDFPSSPLEDKPTSVPSRSPKPRASEPEFGGAPPAEDDRRGPRVEEPAPGRFDREESRPRARSVEPRSVAPRRTDPSLDEPRRNDPLRDEAPRIDTPRNDRLDPLPRSGRGSGSDTVRDDAQRGDLVGDGIVSSSTPKGPQRPQLKIEKLAPPNAVIGQPLVYNIMIKNLGETAAHDVVVEDRIPKGTELQGTIPRAELVDKTLVWKLGAMEPGEEKKIAVKVTPISEGQIGSIATVNFVAEVGAKTMITAPKLQVDITAPSQVRMGEAVPFVFRVKNGGSADAKGVIIRNIVPEGMRHPDGNDLEYELGTLAAGQTRDVKLTLTAVKAGSTNNRVIATADGNINEERSARVDVVGPSLSVERLGPKKCYLGRTVTYTTTISNESDRTCDGATVVEVVPAGFEFVDSTPAGNYSPDNRTLSWRLDRMRSGEKVDLKVRLQAKSAGMKSMKVRAVEGGAVSSEVVADTEVVGAATLESQVTIGGGPLGVGDKATIRVLVRNRGNDGAGNVRLKLTLPDEVEFVSSDARTTVSEDGRDVTFASIARLEAGRDSSLQLVLKARKAGDVRIQLQTEADDMRPIAKEEQVVILADEEASNLTPRR
jgi:uncharacterized repeat protein (TIGR01451 family)